MRHNTTPLGRFLSRSSTGVECGVMIIRKYMTPSVLKLTSSSVSVVSIIRQKTYVECFGDQPVYLSVVKIFVSE